MAEHFPEMADSTTTSGLGDGPDARSAAATVTGGSVPGTPGVPAFSLICQQPSPMPVVIAVPHAGRAYAAGLLERMRNPAFAAPKLEDRYVDLLASAVARETGAALLVAHAPRAMIDLNRDTDDVDWDMLGVPAPDASAMPINRLTGRARNGLGLIPRRLPGLGELWKRRLDPAELEARIAAVHAPYHEALGQTLAALRNRWGAALLVDLHSMPPLSSRGGLDPAPEFVVGDRYGASCHSNLVAAAFSYFAERNRLAAHNRPYAGGYVLERHAARQQGIHCLQLEIDRQSYLDLRMVERGPGFDDMIALLVGLVRRLGEEAAAMGRKAIEAESEPVWRDAAE